MKDGAIAIRPITLADIADFQACVAAVMRERRYLAYVDPLPLAETTAYVAGNVDRCNPHFVADDDGSIIGWCDICRESVPAYAHEGMLGMGVAEDYRGRGVGERLLRATLDAARCAGFERVSLSVYARNTRAAALYRKVGFILEGTRVRGKKLDGMYDDVHQMAYFMNEESPPQ